MAVLTRRVPLARVRVLFWFADDSPRQPISQRGGGRSDHSTTDTSKGTLRCTLTCGQARKGHKDTRL